MHAAGYTGVSTRTHGPFQMSAAGKKKSYRPAAMLRSGSYINMNGILHVLGARERTDVRPHRDGPAVNHDGRRRMHADERTYWMFNLGRSRKFAPIVCLGLGMPSRRFSLAETAFWQMLENVEGPLPPAPFAAATHGFVSGLHGGVARLHGSQSHAYMKDSKHAWEATGSTKLFIPSTSMLLFSMLYVPRPGATERPEWAERFMSECAPAPRCCTDALHGAATTAIALARWYSRATSVAMFAQRTLGLSAGASTPAPSQARARHHARSCYCADCVRTRHRSPCIRRFQKRQE